MHNYSYDNVTSLLESIGADTIYHGYRLKWLQSNYPNLLNQLVSVTSFLNPATLTERLYCYTNDIKYRPKCKMCKNTVTYSRIKKEYHTYCSQRCSMSDMKTLLGVENTSQLELVKQKKKESAITKYGVDNPSKAPEIKLKIAKIRSKQWDDFFDKLINDSKGQDIIEISEKEYNRRVWKISNYMYRLHRDNLDPNRTRGDKFHLDHKFSIKNGYINSIPAHIIGDITNLVILSASKNTSKSYRNSIEIHELITEYNKFYSAKVLPNINEILHKKIQVSSVRYYEHDFGICRTCGSIAHFKFENNQKWCCQPSRNSCLGMKTKNSTTQKLSEKKKEATQKRVASRII